MTADPHAALTRLRTATQSGELDRLCQRYGVRVLSAFGSAVRRTAQPRDLDVAVSFGRQQRPDVLGFLDALMALCRTDAIDLMVLDRAGPVARERGLVAAVPLYEAEQGAYAEMQMAAILDRMDTEWLRRLDLEVMSR